jgi:hypothetical protein
MLGSWKEIACYLGKGVRTVQRWERQFGLPVRRPNASNKGVVCALPDELDTWFAVRWGRRNGLEPNSENGTRPSPEVRANVETSHRLHRANHQLTTELVQFVRSVREGCEALALESSRFARPKN